MTRWVRQEDPCGCGLACLAMVTGAPYAEVRAAWPEWWNFQTGGIDHYQLTQYLGDRGIAHVFRYRFALGRNGVTLDGNDTRLTRPDWPQPFAPVHIISINGGRHNVVLLADGAVLDPMQESPRVLSDVGEVSFMVGVWPGIQLPSL